jgi:outer membrane protein
MKITVRGSVMALLFILIPASSLHAQQKIGYVDSEYILGRTPEYATIQQQLDRMAEDWNRELEDMRKALDLRFKDYQARELLYTSEERGRRRSEIMQDEEALERQRAQYFGPEGEIFSEQEKLMRPIQEQILKAIEEVATAEGFDYIFDKTGDFLFLFAREQWNMSDRVLQELGIDANTNSGGANNQ